MADLTIADVRQKYSQYGDMTDEQVGKALHDKYYSDIPYEAFAQKIALTSPATVSGIAAEGAKGVVRGASNTAMLIPEAMSHVLGPILGPIAMTAINKLAAPSRELIAPNAQNNAEQMASTGGEIAGATIAGGGIAGGPVRTAMNVAL